MHLPPSLTDKVFLYMMGLHGFNFFLTGTEQLIQTLAEQSAAKTKYMADVTGVSTEYCRI